MKILHVVQNYQPSRGGTQLLFGEVSERLVQQYGDEVTVCTTNALFGPEKKYFTSVPGLFQQLKGVTIRRFAFNRFHLPVCRALYKGIVWLGFGTPALLQRYINGPWSRNMQRFIHRYDGDVICGSSCNYLFMLYPLHKKAAKPFVFMGAIHFPQDPLDNPIPARVLQAIKKSTFYIANTAFEKERLVAIGVEAHKIKVIGCGVDPHKFISNTTSASFKEKYGISNGVLVGYVGRHEPKKGIDQLLDAMELLWKEGKDHQLLIAGAKTAYTPVLEQRIKTLGKYGPYIHIITNFSEAEKVDIYNHIDVFVSVSTEESFGIVYLEAWACKKPVIGAAIGAVSAVIENGTDGYLVAPGNVSALARRVEELCSQPVRRRQMGLAGYQKVAKKYTWNIITAKYRQVYLQAAGLATVQQHRHGIEPAENACVKQVNNQTV